MLTRQSFFPVRTVLPSGILVFTLRGDQPCFPANGDSLFSFSASPHSCGLSSPNNRRFLLAANRSLTLSTIGFSPFTIALRDNRSRRLEEANFERPVSIFCRSSRTSG